MKLDEFQDNTPKPIVAVKKKENVVITNGNSNSILEMLNPLKSININSDLHSFYNFRESKESVLALLKAQENLVFYVLHQNFMCDNAHKEFFKNMVGRFYDLPEKLWEYFCGYEFITVGDKESIKGLVLIQNAPLYYRTINGDLNFVKHKFRVDNLISKNLLFFDAPSLINLHGIKDPDYTYSGHFLSFNSYEKGRFETNMPYKRMNNFWDIVTDENFNDVFWHYGGYNWLKYSVIASFGIEDLEATFEHIKKKASENKREIPDNELRKWTSEDMKMIRSLLQKFNWSKDYIFNYEDLLNLDVLGLNLTVPWDMELVKFFIRKGYGGRMSENKAVFDLVFKPLLTDEILEMLFKLEYEKY